MILQGDAQFINLSGITLLFPALVAFVISFFTSIAGVSGAFLLLPFQVSVLGFASPSVSATNFLFNVIGCPGGIIRFIREKRMIWPLAFWITAATLPGIFLGYYLRVRYLPDPQLFKFFAGFVLLYIGLLLCRSSFKQVPPPKKVHQDFSISNILYGWSFIEYNFQNNTVRIATWTLALFSLFVGIIGGIYGVGGGALMAPFCVVVLRIPVYTLAGSTLFGTFIASIAGVLFYSLVPLSNGQTTPPNWLLGSLLGIGGLCGMYCGAKFQKKVPEQWIKMILSFIILLVAGKYLFPLLSITSK
ncbi:MAG: sulfite exporter TauE/SafE family protein [Desulfobulbaceae bacterium]|nr:sulfite exporter TauE/SafE family protein [Desulfobulbaceae bacterium]